MTTLKGLALIVISSVFTKSLSASELTIYGLSQDDPHEVRFIDHYGEGIYGEEKLTTLNITDVHFLTALNEEDRTLTILELSIYFFEALPPLKVFNLNSSGSSNSGREEFEAIRQNPSTGRYEAVKLTWDNREKDSLLLEVYDYGSLPYSPEYVSSRNIPLMTLVMQGSFNIRCDDCSMGKLAGSAE